MTEGLPIEWKVEKLGQVSKTFFSNVDKKSYPDSELPVRLCNYMDVYKNEYIKNQMRFMVATAKQREIDKFTMECGDVIITKDSESPDDIAISALVSENLDNVICGYHLALIRPNKKKLTGGYLSHLFGLDSIQHYYYCIANGTTRFGLTADAILNSNLPLAPLPEQKKISKILTSVDEVIEATETQINKLKDLKKGMMNELLTKGIGHTKFKDSAVGRIPVDWKVVKTGDIAKSIVPGRNKPKKFNGNIPWITISDVDSLFIEKSKTGLGVSREVLNDAQGKTVPKNSVIMTVVGEFGISTVAKKEIVINQQLHAFVCSKRVLPVYLCYTIRLFKKQIENLSTQTTISYLNKDNSESILFPLPTLQEQQKIAKILTSIDTNIVQKQTKLTQTKNLKKSLMADLLTGRVRVNVN